MSKVVTMTHYNRPDYTRRSLAALAKCRGIEDCLLLPHVEPVNDEVIALLRAASFCECRVTINPTKLQVDPNTIRCFDEAFAISDFCLHVEDDILLAEDALEFFWWAKERYADDPTVMSVTGYTKGDSPPPEQHHHVERRAWFHPWSIATWKDRYVKCRPTLFEVTSVCPDTVTRTSKPGRLMWDGAFHECLKRWDLCEVFPTLGRAQNIGEDSSIHLGHGSFFTRDWHAAHQHSPYWAGDGREVASGAWEEAR